MLPCPGYYKQCCDEHWGTRVSFPSELSEQIASSEEMVYMDKRDDWVFTKNYEAIYHKREKKIGAQGKCNLGLYNKIQRTVK